MNKIHLYSIKDDTKKYSDSIDFVSKYRSTNNSFLFAIHKKNSLSCIEGDLTEFSEDIFDVLSESLDKEVIYIRAIKNLLRKKEYLNLLYEYSNNLITDEEFGYELEVNEDKYLIHIDEELNNKSFNLLSKVIQKIGEDFTDDDLSEIFSVRTNNIINLMIPKSREIDEGGSL